MPTEKPRVTFTVTSDELDAINEYRFETKQKNQTQAIISLIELGLKEVQKEGPALQKESGPKMPDGYDKLSPESRELVDALILHLSKQQ